MNQSLCQRRPTICSKEPCTLSKEPSDIHEFFQRCIHMRHDAITRAKVPYNMVERALYFVKRVGRYTCDSFQDAFICDMTQSLCQRSPIIYSKEPCTFLKEPSDIHATHSAMHSYATWLNSFVIRALQFTQKSPVLCQKSLQIYAHLIPRCI